VSVMTYAHTAPAVLMHMRTLGSANCCYGNICTSSSSSSKLSWDCSFLVSPELAAAVGSAGHAAMPERAYVAVQAHGRPAKGSQEVWLCVGDGILLVLQLREVPCGAAKLH
jgi:hypothetical protein